MSSRAITIATTALLLVACSAMAVHAETFTDPSGYKVWMPAKAHQVNPNTKIAEAGANKELTFLVAHFELPEEPLSRLTMRALRKVAVQRPMKALQDPKLVAIDVGRHSGRESNTVLLEGRFLPGDPTVMQTLALIVYADTRLFFAAATFPKGAAPKEVTRFFDSYELTAAAPTGDTRAHLKPSPWHGATAETPWSWSIEAPDDLPELKKSPTEDGGEIFVSVWRGAPHETFAVTCDTRAHYRKLGEARERFAAVAKGRIKRFGLTRTTISNHGANGVKLTGKVSKGGQSFAYREIIQLKGSSIVYVSATAKSPKEAERFVTSWTAAR